MTRHASRWLAGAAALALFATALPATAQKGSWEVTPMVGYRFGGTTSTVSTSYIDQVTVPESLSFGLGIEYGIHPNGTVEFLWSHQDTELRADWVRTPPAGYTDKLSDLKIDTFQVGGLWQSGRPGDAVRGWLDLLMGMTIIAPSGQYSSLTRFSISIGGGAKFRMTDTFGAKVGLRYMPVYINSEGSGYVYCDPWYGCYTYYNANYLNQWDASVGLTFKF